MLVPVGQTAGMVHRAEGGGKTSKFGAHNVEAAWKFSQTQASAAQCRALVPFGLKLSRDLLDASDGMESTARHAMNHLSQCYVSLSDSSIFFADALREHSTKFALLYCALETTATNDWSWRVKPKLHMFLELCSEGSRPATFWTYRDEDFGGSVSRLSRRRGGP